jgi:type II secretory pathway pseudopilin PulG
MRRRNGWSLVELTLTIVIVATLAVFVGPMLLGAVQAYGATADTVATYAKMRYAMARVSYEIREMRRDVNDVRNFDITTMTATSLTFTKTDGTQVAIGSAGSSVTLNYVGTASGTLTDQLQPGSLSFAYYTQNGTQIAVLPDPTNVVYVEVSMTLVQGANAFANRLRVDLRSSQ